MLDTKTLEELRKTGRAADRVDRERLELFQSMLKTPAWAAYVELLNACIQEKGDAIIQPALGVDRCVALEYEKGALSGLIKARDLPSVIIAAMKASLPAKESDDDE